MIVGIHFFLWINFSSIDRKISENQISAVVCTYFNRENTHAKECLITSIVTPVSVVAPCAETSFMGLTPRKTSETLWRPLPSKSCMWAAANWPMGFLLIRKRPPGKVNSLMIVSINSAVLADGTSDHATRMINGGRWRQEPLELIKTDSISGTSNIIKGTLLARLLRKARGIIPWGIWAPLTSISVGSGHKHNIKCTPN